MRDLSREKVLETIRHAQRQLCGYDFYGMEGVKQDPPSRCDCKFSTVGSHGRPLKGGDNGETTGCPELRVIHEMIGGLTETEFDFILAWSKVRRSK